MGTPNAESLGQVAMFPPMAGVQDLSGHYPNPNAITARLMAHGFNLVGLGGNCDGWERRDESGEIAERILDAVPCDGREFVEPTAPMALTDRVGIITAEAGEMDGDEELPVLFGFTLGDVLEALDDPRDEYHLLNLRLQNWKTARPLAEGPRCLVCGALLEMNPGGTGEECPDCPIAPVVHTGRVSEATPGYEARNAVRAERGEALRAFYLSEGHGEAADLRATVGDMIADLLHCERARLASAPPEPGTVGTPDEGAGWLADLGKDHFEAERRGDD